MSFKRALFLGLFASAAAIPVLAQTTSQPEEPGPTAAASEVDDSAVADDATLAEGEDADATLVEAVTVTAQRRRGATLGDIPPEVELNAAEIQALGAGSITELLQLLEPQIRSGRGRGGEQPITLLNGRRISGFSELRSIPPEAIERFEILPEEVALKYGYRADQRVVNIVLRERYRARTVELEAGGPTAGGRSDVEADASVLRINRRGRSNLDIEYRRSTALFEDERDVLRVTRGAPFDLVGNIGATVTGAEIDPALSALAGRPVTVAGVPVTAAAGTPSLADFAPGVPNITDLGRFRTLLPETERVSVNGTINRTILTDIGFTLNARYDLSTNRSQFGLPSATLRLDADSPFSPFAQDTLLYRFLDTAGPLGRENESDTAHLGLVLDRYTGNWRYALTANFDRVESLNLTDAGLDLTGFQARLDAGDPTLNPFAAFPAGLVTRREPDRGQSTTQTANAELVVNGTLRELAAGPLSTTIKLGAEALGFESESLRGGLAQEIELSRDRGEVQVSLDVPIASRRREVRTALGNLSANFNVAVNQLSDFGSLTTLGYGVTWSPREQLTLIASVTEEDGAPSVQQLGNPVLVTPNVPFFDFTRGETVEVFSVDGGNPGLLSDSRRVLKLGATLRPFEERDLSFSANYTATRIEDPITGFPGLTAEIEAAFPDRFERDALGRLLRIDTRSVNFARSDRQEVRYGVNWSKALRPAGAETVGSADGRGPRAGLGPAAAPTATAQGAPARSGAAGTGPAGTAFPGQATAAERAQRRDRAQAGGGEQPGGGVRVGGGRPGGPGGGRGFGGGGFGRGGNRPGEGRIQLSLYHTYRFEDSVLISEGGPELDFLNGSAVGSRGGRSRHELDLQASLFKSGYGGFLNARYQSGSTVIGGVDDAADGDLSFSGLTTVNLRVFADLGQQQRLVRRYPFFRGSRVSLALNNLFDDRLDVRDLAGSVPISFQPDLLDPTGRLVRLSFRKLFSGPPDAERRARQAAAGRE